MTGNIPDVYFMLVGVAGLVWLSILIVWRTQR